MHPTRHMADVSSNNRFYNAEQYRAAGHTRVAIKATESSDYVNPDLTDWARASHRQGMAVSFYHFCRPENHNVVTEINHFWRHVKPLWLPGDALHLDLEVAIALFGPEDLARYHNKASALLRRVSGHDTITYMNESYYDSLSSYLETQYKEYWIAAYGPRRPRTRGRHKLWGWQFTDGVQGPAPHSAAGVGQCDLSSVNLRTVTADFLRLARTRRRAVG
jgi:lysozyme